MSSTAGEELQRQLTELEEETKSLREMTTSIDDLQEKLDANQAARTRLRKKMIETGYKM